MQSVVEDFKKEVPVKVMIQLLQQAVLEEDPEKRFPPIKEACKIMTEAIPYKKRLRGFTKEKELLFYVMLLEIFNKKTIQLIMTTLLAKLPEFPDFIYLFYHGFLEIAQCPESQIQRYGVEYKLPNQPQLVKYVDPEYKRELNRDILKYIKYIKETAFEYFKRFVLENTEGILLFDANLDLLKIIIAFVKNTQLIGFTAKVCGVLEQLLANPYGNKLIKNKRLATEMLNALNISENTVRRIINKFPTKAEKAERALKQPTANTLRKISSTSMMQQQQQASFSRSVSNFENSLTDLSPKKVTGANKDEMTDEESVIIDEIEEDEDEETLIANLQRLEEWLLKSSDFSLLEDDELLHFFRENRQIIIFIKMILDPFEPDCSVLLYSKFEELAPKINQVPFQLVNCNFKPLSPHDDDNPPVEEKFTDKHKFEALYMYRAYLCKRILDDEFNWDQIILGAPHFISEFFSSLYQALQNPFPRVNIHLVLEIIELFLRRDPEQTLLNIIQSNVPFILLNNIQMPLVRDFLINLINLPQNYFNMDSTSLFRLAKYLKFSNFFLDFLSLLLDKNYQFDITKMNITNKHDEISDIYDAIQKMSRHLINAAYKAKAIPQICAINLEKLNKENLKDSNELLAEERLGLESDIDRIMPFLNQETSISHVDTSYIGTSPRLPTVQSSVPSNPRISGLERPTISVSPTRQARIYPSMLESIKNEEETAKLRDKTPIASANNISRFSKRGGISPMTPVGATPSIKRPKLIRELSDENMSIINDISRTNNGTPLPLHHDKERSSVAIPGERHSSITSQVTSDDTPQGPYQYNFLNEAPTPIKKERRSERLMGRKSKDSMTATPQQFHQFQNNTLLKIVHPDVKQSIYVNHFQHLNAPLTQSILGVHALPSKSMTRSTSLPALGSKPAKETKILEEPGDPAQRQVMYSPEEIKKNEEQAYPLAVAVHEMIQMYFENYKPTGLMTKIGIKSTANLRIISCIQGDQDAKFFAILLKNYLLKFAHTIEQEESSSAICGKIINNLLSRLNDYKSFKSLSTSIHQESCNYVFLLGKVLAESIKWKPKSKPRVYLQNYVVHEIFGSNRLTLLTTLYHILQNDSINGYKILMKLPEPFWHTLAYWFVELKHQNMFLNVATKIFRIALRHGPEPLLLKILVKVNILSMLKTAYHDVDVNPTCGKMLRTESFLLSLKEFALDVDFIQANRCELRKINGFLELFDSWRILKKGLLGTDDLLRLTTSTSVSLFRKTRSRNNSPADNKNFINILNEEKDAGGSQFKKASSTVSLKKLIEKRVERAPSQDLIRLKINTERGSEKKGTALEVPGMTARVEKTEKLLEHSETAKKIILPNMPKENRNHRSQTTLKVRHKSNIRI